MGVQYHHETSAEVCSTLHRTSRLFVTLSLTSSSSLLPQSHIPQTLHRNLPNPLPVRLITLNLEPNLPILTLAQPKSILAEIPQNTRPMLQPNPSSDTLRSPNGEVPRAIGVLELQTRVNESSVFQRRSPQPGFMAEGARAVGVGEGAREQRCEDRAVLRAEPFE
jgi:hypothetical protein